MSLNEDIAIEIQKLDPSSMIELYELDCTDLGGDLLRFHNGTNKLSQNLFWQGNEYARFPIQITGFEVSGQGQFPRPTATVSNVQGVITAILMQYGDLIGAKFTRKRTLLKYLDAVNFPGNVNPTADTTVYLPDDVYYVDRKSHEDRDTVQFELASAADLQGVKLPKRTVIQNVCPWVYRGVECGYTGIPLWDKNDQQIPAPTSAEAIAMMQAYDDLNTAKATLATAQATLVTASNALTAASIYSTEERYQTTAPLNAVFQGIGGGIAWWDNAQVTLGTTYSQGSFQGTVPELWNTQGYKIIKHTRNETAYNAALAAYNAAVIARDNAQDDVDTAQNDFDVALAAVPLDDDVYKNDVCGKRLTSCKLRFGDNGELPYGGFPGASR